MKRSIDRNTLYDFFDGKTTSLQRKMIEEWLRQKGNEERYYLYLDEWESQQTQFVPDENAALERYRFAMTSKGPATQNVPVRKAVSWKSRIRGYRFLLSGIAACFMILSLSLWNDWLFYAHYENVAGESSSFTLDDGTNVKLNGNAALWVPRFGFSTDSRRVRLEGEAEFHVTRTPDASRFVVVMNDGYSIEVLGTKFVALSRNRNKRVYLTEGKVKLTLPEGRQIYMKPGHLFEADREKPGKLSTPEQPQKYIAWTTHQFYFDNTPLTEVVRQMEERFGVTIVIADRELGQKELGGIYDAHHADDLLQVLSELFKIEISKNEDRIELRPAANL